MIKYLTLVLAFYRKNILAVLVLLLLMTTSLLYMVDIMGYIGFRRYSLQMMDTLSLADGLYVMPADGFNEVQASITPTYDAFLEQNFSAVEKTINPAYSYVGYGDLSLNIVVYDQIWIDTYDCTDVGKWFASDTSPAEAPIEVVVGGFALQGLSVGEVFQLEVHHLDETPWKQVPVTVVGKDYEPTMGLELGYTADAVTADKLFVNVNNIVYMTKESFLRLYGADVSYRHNNFFVCFQPHATEAERQQVLAFVSAHGRSLSFADIRDRSQAELTATLRKTLPLPLCMLGVSSFAMLAVSVLLTNQQMKTYQIYYLVGCSRRRTAFLTALGISGIGLVSGGITMLYLLYLNLAFLSLKSADSIRYHNYLVMNSSGGYVVLYILITVLLATLIPFALHKKHSTFELHRRML